MNKKKIKIGINVSFLRKPNTGIGQVTINFLKHLKNIEANFKEKEVNFILYAEKPYSQISDLNLPENTTFKILSPLWKRDDLIRKIWWEKYLLPKQTKKDKCNLFLSLYQCPTVFNKTKHLMLVHDIIPKLFPEYLNNSRKKLYWKLTEKAIKKASKIIAVSEHTQKDLIQYLDIAPEKIIVNYIDVDPIYKKEVSSKKSQEVLKKYNLKPGYLYNGGGLEARKNTERLLKAYKLLLNKFLISNFQFLNEPSRKVTARDRQATNYKPQIPLLVISGKLMPELAPLITDVEKLVKDLGLQDKVKLLDFVPQKDLPALYRSASIFIYPSLYEGFGLPILEAMNCGTPVVASSISSLPEIGGKAILYCNPKSIKDIAQKIEKILSNNNLRNEFSVKGKKQAEKFSWKKFMEKLTENI